MPNLAKDALVQRVRDAAEPGVMQVIEWAKMVHEDTMQRMQQPHSDLLSYGKYSFDEREEARKILLEYGIGKPTRVVEHKGSQSHVLKIETEIVPSGSSKQLAAPVINAEIVELNEASDS